MPILATNRFLAVVSLSIATIAVASDDFPAPRDTEPAKTKPLSPAEAAAGFRAPPGFRVNVFASEPDVRNPVAMNWDTRGRLWIAENYTYSDLTDKFDLRLRDRVLIFEDADHDGRFDKRTVFTDQVQKLGGVEVGMGGVWLICPPQLLFVPDRNGDDVPDGPAEVVLDGFKTVTENHHTFANGLKWGPDGWLYGRCGASSPADVGPPGASDAERIPVRGGIWRYHPVRKRFETLAHGTTNPWGHDWDALGEAFFINTVNGHLWHLIPGSHLARPHTIEPNPRVYTTIDQHADHYHFDTSKELSKTVVPGGIDDERGGGHAHVGMMIYLSDQWPEYYLNKLFTLSFHGRRVNVEKLARGGSGFVGTHEPDMLFAADPWFRGIDLAQAPDGSVFILDWSDTGECHEHEGVHRSSGRVYRVSYKEPLPVEIVDVAKLGENELVALHRHANEWFVRRARRELADRAAGGQRLESARAGLRDLFEQARDTRDVVRAFCSLFAIGAADRAFLRAALKHSHESVRAWAIRFLTDDLPIDTIYSRRGGPEVELPSNLRDQFESLARGDSSGLVRLVLASTLQRLPVSERVTLARALASRAEDANDHNIPALVWMGLIPVADANPESLCALACESKLPETTRSIARRLGEDIETRPAALNQLLVLAVNGSTELQKSVVSGLGEALKGWHKATKPAAWEAFTARRASSNEPALTEQIRELNVLFGDGRALAEVTRIALDEKATMETRKAALRTVVENRPPDLRKICERLIRVRFLNVVAVRGLALFDDAKVGSLLADNYRSFHPSERPVLLDVLASRPVFARAWLDRIAAGKIPRQELTAFHARQIRDLGDRSLSERLAQVWGELREASADKRGRMETLQTRLQPADLATADRGHGRAVFNKICGTCHKLYGYGAEIGPDLTGSQRDNLAFLLENVVDPSASLSADFRMVSVALKDGRVLNGLVRAQSERTLTLQTQTDAVVLDRADVEEIRPSSLSLMPDGLLDQMTETETRDLFAYLMQRTQVPLPGGEAGVPQSR
jgi:putative membrane-bound dehydrogenase-like protein